MYDPHQQATVSKAFMENKAAKVPTYRDVFGGTYALVGWVKVQNKFFLKLAIRNATYVPNMFRRMLALPHWGTKSIHHQGYVEIDASVC